RPHFDVLTVRALDYGQALTGRFRVLDRAAWSRPGQVLLRKALPLLEDPKWPVLPMHGMHIAVVGRRAR
ncbi:MAG: hypothetical protein QOJ09_2037, partial [Actinomycetota bacterium]|nr:hypothetical protein [Actinomycetota bacterium]